MNILGINAYHGDAAACILKDGRLVAAAEEERFLRVKHWAGFPENAVRYCLKTAGVDPKDLQHVAVNRDPSAHIFQKMFFALARQPSFRVMRDRFVNSRKITDIRSVVSRVLDADYTGVIHRVEHHRAHLASAFMISPYEEAAVVSVDGFGDFVSSMWGVGKGGNIQVIDEVLFPHSLGLFYLALTQFLGFTRYGDEYKVMGLSAYGRPTEMEKMRQIVLLRKNGKFELNLDYFLHHAEGVSMVWEGGEPVIGRAYSDQMIALLGAPRQPEGEVLEQHKNIAASMQAMYEEAFFHILRHVHRQTEKKTLCLAGGCAMNSVANGKIYTHTPFNRLYVQCAAGDAGGAIGAAFYVWNRILKKPRSFMMDHAYWGPEFTQTDIKGVLDKCASEISGQGCEVTLITDEAERCQVAAQAIADGKVVGWFQGRMEWGPRALGNRSIVCDPRRRDMKDILNLKIKRRESFRPFAPSILREAVSEWFEIDDDVPFMLQVYPIRESKRSLVPAVTHVNGSGRLQTVTSSQNPLYYRLISAFHSITGVPMVLNTSFNENEPIVCRPEEALDCFLRTQMEVLVLGPYRIQRS